MTAHIRSTGRCVYMYEAPRRYGRISSRIYQNSESDAKGLSNT